MARKTIKPETTATDVVLAAAAAAADTTVPVAAQDTTATPSDMVAQVADASASRGDTIIVTGPRAGRRRAGLGFGLEPVTLFLADLTEDQLAAIANDPMLTMQPGQAAQ